MNTNKCQQHGIQRKLDAKCQVLVKYVMVVPQQIQRTMECVQHHIIYRCTISCKHLTCDELWRIES